MSVSQLESQDWKAPTGSLLIGLYLQSSVTYGSKNEHRGDKNSVFELS